MPRALILAALPVLLLAGCTEFPELDARIPEADRVVPPPALIDVAPLLASAAALEGGARLTSADRSQADQRLARLRARAAALRGAEVVDAATRDRLRSGVALPPALQ